MGMLQILYNVQSKKQKKYINYSLHNWHLGDKNYVVANGSAGKNPLQCRRQRRCELDAWFKEDPLEKEVATHPSILAWRIPCTEEPGILQSMGSQS